MLVGLNNLRQGWKLPRPGHILGSWPKSAKTTVKSGDGAIGSWPPSRMPWGLNPIRSCGVRLVTAASRRSTPPRTACGPISSTVWRIPVARAGTHIRERRAPIRSHCDGRRSVFGVKRPGERIRFRRGWLTNCGHAIRCAGRSNAAQPPMTKQRGVATMTDISSFRCRQSHYKSTLRAPRRV